MRKISLMLVGLMLVGLMLSSFAVGCGSKSGVEPAASQTEMEKYAAENPAPPTVEVPSE